MEFGPILRSMGRNKVRYGLIVVEVALTLAIVANCVNMIGDARREMARPSGFDDDNILSVRSAPFAPAFKEDGYLDAALRKDIEVLRAIPGVHAVSNTRFLPWQGGGSSTTTRVLGSKGEMLRNQVYNADESTLETLGSRLVEGRNFTREEVESDTKRLREVTNSNRPRGADGQPIDKISQDVIISRAFGDLLFKDGKSLGKSLEDDDGDQYRIVGVIDHFYNPYGWPIHEYVMFFPNYSRSFQGGSAYLLRVDPGKMKTVRPQVEKALLAANAGRNVQLKELTEIKERFQSQSALLVKILSLVIFLLLFVTSLGIVGLTVFSVAERTRQIGTRRALGARKLDILGYFLLENWLVTTMGLVIGVALAYGLNVALVTRLNGTRMDAGLVIIGVALLWIFGLGATYFPARKGAAVAPAVATRNV
ncbi:MAG: FtsX-like permease family protein [Acidobacteria bacterium]|nr:FtsX-like permease family protein [Acidobacteriota bacterium]MCA1611393.1 FtsX-like permease family protein [Acidobacteriota bacterium]